MYISRPVEFIVLHALHSCYVKGDIPLPVSLVLRFMCATVEEHVILGEAGTIEVKCILLSHMTNIPLILAVGCTCGYIDPSLIFVVGCTGGYLTTEKQRQCEDNQGVLKRLTEVATGRNVAILYDDCSSDSVAFVHLKLSFYHIYHLLICVSYFLEIS